MTKFDLKVSIVIPAYNYGELLPRAVRSATGQSYKNLEILIVDDGSTDDTLAVAKKLSEEHTWVTAHTKENGGASSARNYGITKSTGDYLLFLDADDYLEPDALTQALSKIDQVKNVEDSPFIVCDHYSFDDSGDKKYIAAIKQKQLPIDPGEVLLTFFDKKISVPNGAVLMPRRMFDEIKYNETLKSSEDIPVMAYALTSFKVTYIPMPLNAIYRHDGSYRTQTWRVKEQPYAPIDEFYAYPQTKERFDSVKNTLYGRRALSVFRTLYLAGEHKLARHYYIEALKFSPRLATKMSYLMKFIRSWI